jgi:hypothetical protein
MESDEWDIISSDVNGELTTTKRCVGLGRVYNRQSRCKDLAIDNSEVIAVGSGSEHERSQRRGKSRGHQHCDSKASNPRQLKPLQGKQCATTIEDEETKVKMPAKSGVTRGDMVNSAMTMSKLPSFSDPGLRGSYMSCNRCIS